MAINDQKMGWVDKPREVDLIKSQMQHPLFSGAAPLLRGTGKGKKALLHQYYTQLGIPFPLRHQTDSDCVSMGTALAVDTRKVAEIIQGERESWVAQTSTEDIYSGSRMIIGGGRISGGGSVGIWAAKYINKNNYGTLIRKKYSFADLTTYSGQRAAQWGNQKQSQALLDEAKLHPIGDFTSIENYEDVCDALYNDYPVIVCSQQGFSSTRDVDGFARPQGSWAHCMCFIAFDDEYKRPGVLCVNSWGPNWISGPKRHEQPDGSFWISPETVNRMCSMGDTFSIANFDGFKIKPDARVI